ncbi:CNNM domain-containing protein, partial [Staphylococcus aureus]|uniref:CNNM domain-containing protein n=1 Tax=Staphylococcus aureus TaxID=1280 RepID=UPI000B227801
MEISIRTRLTIFLLLIALTAVFVVSVFALVKIRETRIEQLADVGNKPAKIVKKMIANLDYYLSACQLGITVTSLGLGWLG